MQLEQIKIQIQNRTLPDNLIIFQYDDIPFIAEQYIKEISSYKNLKINYISSLYGIGDNIFIPDTDMLNVFMTDTLDDVPDSILGENNLYIITHKIDKKINSKISSYICSIDKLQNWQIDDYMTSILNNINKDDVLWLCKSANHNIYRLQQEADKIMLFPDAIQQDIFNMMKNDGAFSDLSDLTIFNFTNSIISRNYAAIHDVLEAINNIDVEPIGLVTILYQQFRKLIQVWGNAQPTEQNTGLKPNVIYAINKLPRTYSNQQLINNFIFLTGIDKELKIGNIDSKWLIDYTLCKVLSA